VACFYSFISIVMEADTLKQKTEELTDHLGDYADTFLKITLLNVTEKAANIASSAITTIVLCGLGLFVLFFVGFGLAWWLGDMINSRTGGFMITGGLYLLLVILVVALKKKAIVPYLRNLIIRKVYE
jgi:hypothetical protein